MGTGKKHRMRFGQPPLRHGTISDMVRTKEQSQNPARLKGGPRTREEQPLQVALAPLTGGLWRRRTAALNLLFVLAAVLTSAILAVLFLTLPAVRDNGIVIFHVGSTSLVVAYRRPLTSRFRSAGDVRYAAATVSASRQNCRHQPAPKIFPMQCKPQLGALPRRLGQFQRPPTP